MDRGYGNLCITIYRGHKRTKKGPGVLSAKVGDLHKKLLSYYRREPGPLLMAKRIIAKGPASLIQDPSLG
jgi:hypothetical protein